MGPLVPLFPLSFITGYHYDMAYGTKWERINAEAHLILEKERNTPRFALPEGNLLITPTEYDTVFKNQ